MSAFRHISSVVRRTSHMPLLAAVIVAGHLAWSPGHAANFGHSRLVSAVGEPLRITIPVTEISASEIETLRIVPAPASAWTNAGLVPPVDPATLQTRLTDGFAPGVRIIQVWSDQVFNRPIADLLLDIHTSSGVQRYQVSLLAHGGATAIQAPAFGTGVASDQRPAADPAPAAISQTPILIRRGDTMFAIAQRHAVPGVSVYQMMIALQRANPQAFIHNNINLVKADEQLVMPDRDALTAISDREARRLFHEQVVAFDAYRQGQGDAVFGELTTAQDVTRVAPGPDESPADSLSNVPQDRVASGDQLKLSSGRPGSSVSGTQPATAGADQGSSPGAATGSGQNTASGVSTAADAQAAEASEAARVQTIQTATAASANGIATADADATRAGNAKDGSGTALASANATASSGVPADTNTLNADGTVAANDGSQADDALAARKAIEDAELRVSQLEENVKNLNQALQSQGEAAKDLVVDGAIGLRQSLTDVATAVTDATIGDDDFLDSVTGTPTDPASASGTPLQIPQDKATTTMESIATWLQANLIGVITALLALAVLVIAWVLRRANISRSRAEGAITPEMVKEKLDEINLDLNEPTISDPRPRS